MSAVEQLEITKNDYVKITRNAVETFRELCPHQSSKEDAVIRSKILWAVHTGTTVKTQFETDKVQRVDTAELGHLLFVVKKTSESSHRGGTLYVVTTVLLLDGTVAHTRSMGA